MRIHMDSPPYRGQIGRTGDRQAKRQHGKRQKEASGEKAWPSGTLIDRDDYNGRRMAAKAPL